MDWNKSYNNQIMFFARRFSMWRICCWVQWQWNRQLWRWHSISTAWFVFTGHCWKWRRNSCGRRARRRLGGGYHFGIYKQKNDCNDHSTDDECEQNENEIENRCHSHHEILNLLTRIENFAKIADQDLMNTVIEMKTLTEAKILKNKQKSFQMKIFDYFRK